MDDAIRGFDDTGSDAGARPGDGGRRAPAPDAVDAAVHGVRDACHALCTDSPLTARLARAHAVLTKVEATGLPGSLSARFEELVADLAYGADSIIDALTQMSAVDREVLAKRIVTFYGQLSREAGPE